MKKKTTMVRAAMKSSDVQAHQERALRGDPYGYPYVARPSESRMMVSNRLRAAIMAGEDGTADSSDSDVCVDGGTGIGT